VSGRPLSLAVYAMATGLVEPFARALLEGRARRGKEDPARRDERLGRPAIARPPGPLGWIHGVSVGESLAHLPLVERFRRERPEITVLVTSGTRTSAELLARRLPDGVIHQYAPVDAPAAARRFAGHWKPDLAIFVESELWPNLLFAADEQGARLALLSARLSASSMRSWDRLPGAAQAMLDLFDLILPQDQATADWTARHGARVSGWLDLKRAAGRLPVDEPALTALRGMIGERPVMVAASTHPGEEALIAEAVGGLESQPLLIVVPRHPERGGEVAELLTGAGWTVARRSQGEKIGKATGAYVADTLGELGLFYALANVVVMGGSFVSGLAGHNPLEPARFSRPVISGPNMANFTDAYAELVVANAAEIADGPAALRDALAPLFATPPLAHAMGARALALAEQGHEDFDRAWAQLAPLVPAP
jgi:3-deoxy-D-manno-octulosonic-acid transferase